MTGIAHGYTKPSAPHHVPSCLASNGRLKVRHRSRAAANRARRELGAQRFVYGPCADCGGFHLTSRKPKA